MAKSRQEFSSCLLFFLVLFYFVFYLRLVFFDNFVFFSFNVFLLLDSLLLNKRMMIMKMFSSCVLSFFRLLLFFYIFGLCFFFVFLFSNVQGLFLLRMYFSLLVIFFCRFLLDNKNKMYEKREDQVKAKNDCRNLFL